jgi:hypothetical protein
MVNLASASKSTAIHRPVSIVMFVMEAPLDFMQKIMITLMESVETVGVNWHSWPVWETGRMGEGVDGFGLVLSHVDRRGVTVTQAMKTRQ